MSARARERSILWLVAAVLLAALGILLSAPPAYRIAGAAAGLGATIAIVGVGGRLTLPFFVMLLFVLACAFCIDRCARAAFSRKSREH